MKQISIVAPEKPGLLATITEAVAAAGVNIDTIDAEAVAGTGVIIMTVDKYDEALRALARAGFQAVSEDAILVRLTDEPGSLAGITRRFKDANINLRSVRFVQRANGHGVVAIATERTPEALELVKDVLIA